MKEIRLSFPLRAATWQEDRKLADAIAEEVAARFGLEVGDTGAGGGYRDVALEMPEGWDLESTLRQVVTYVREVGFLGIDVSAGGYQETLIRGKWLMDGAKSLPEAAHLLRNFADELDQMARDGWELESPMTDDYGHLRKEYTRG